MPKKRAVFLDRDGVIVCEVAYLRRPEQLRLLKGSAAGIAALRRAGFKVMMASNQSGVSRGYVSLATLHKIHARLKRLLAAEGAKLDAIYFCPHHPDDRCRCRKPLPGMLQAASRKHGLDLSRSFMIGDRTSDLMAGKNAGARAILVRTGIGGKDRAHKVVPDATCRNLGAAARWILRASQK
jgi:histidinol-phosphate phosphatase family protein